MFAKATEVCRMDWFHCLLQDGVLNTEFRLFLQATGIPVSDLERFLQAEWQFPAHMEVKHRRLHVVFNEWRTRSNDAADKFKCSASELLGVYGLVRHFCTMRWTPTPAVELPYASFLQACKLVDVILDCKSQAIPQAQIASRIRAAIGRFFDAHKAAYGSSHFLPKHHWLWDVAQQAIDTPHILDNFILERLHLRVRDLANKLDNTTRYEASLLASLMHFQDASLASQSLKVGLCENTLQDVPGTLPGTRVSRSLQTSLGQQLTVGDVCFHGSTSHAGRIKACISQNGVSYVAVALLARVEKLTDESAAYRPTELRHAWPADDVVAASAWYQNNFDLVVLQR